MLPRKFKRVLSDDPLWYKDGIIYQAHVKAFFDSNADGIGDFKGLTAKLDYLQDLGITALWLLPFYPSPMRDDGYDIGEYTAVHPAYGTLRDFHTFLNEAHKRGLRVITELVINHTSDQHEWFQKSRRAKPGSPWRDFYVWTDDPEKYKEARIIFKDFESSNWTWDPVAHAYYWHRFYHHQPDLNFENEAVHDAVAKVLDFWMKMGVDGLRLDAVPYLYEQEGTSCENLPRTHDYLKKLRRHVDANFTNRMLLAEANQWPEDALPYFGDGDECHVAFHFPLMPRLFMSVAMEDRFPIVDIMQQTPEIPPNCQWAVFLRNHDELTLEMVTDEDRDYMYRTYAKDTQARINLGIRRRLAPLLGNHRRRIELMNALLFSFPGTPIIYYGDEIGMGDNIYLGDRNGVRTPMQWSADRNAGFSRTNPQRLYMPIIIDPEYHYEAVNVDGQQNNPNSLLWWMKRLIDLRKRLKALGRGSLEFLHPENRKVVAFLRQYEEEKILVVANLSRFVQSVELDLSSFQGLVPVELFGRTEFPRVTHRPYVLTLGPQSFYWLALESRQQEDGSTVVRSDESVEIPEIDAAGWDDLSHDPASGQLEQVLVRYMATRRWFGGKAQTVRTATVTDVIRIPSSLARVLLVTIEYFEGNPEVYLLPLAIHSGRPAENAKKRGYAVAKLRNAPGETLLYEAIEEPSFGSALLQLALSRKQVRTGGEARVRVNRSRGVEPQAGLSGEPHVLRAEQSNTAIAFGDQYFLKLLRKIEYGVNPDLEVVRFLTENSEFRNIPELLSALEYEREGEEPMTLAILQRYISNGGDAWKYTLDHLGRFFDRLSTTPLTDAQRTLAIRSQSFIELSSVEVPEVAAVTIGSYLQDAELLGSRTAELHAALAKPTDDPWFRPEPFTPFYQRSIYQSMRSQATRALQLLRRNLRKLPEPLVPEAEALVAREPEIQHRLRRILDRPLGGLRTRIHGDYHLGQILQTGKDFVILDFEGEPGRPLSERRIKRSPLRDVAGMLRSFHYAPYAVLLGQATGVRVRVDDVASLEGAARMWQQWVSAAFLRSYLATASGQEFLPGSLEDVALLLDGCLLEKALYELAYELNNRPSWVAIPIRGALQILEAGP